MFWPIEYKANALYGSEINEITRSLRQAFVVGFNLKYDLHWLRRYGYEIPDDLTCWDVQLAHFILGGMRNPMASLAEVVEEYGVGVKNKDIDEYWARGVNTPDIPWDVIVDRNGSDLEITEKAFLHQLALLANRPKLKKFIWLACQDLFATEDMEYNGLRYDFAKSISMGDAILGRIRDLDGQLAGFIPSIPFNWNSSDHISSYLYGGTVSWTEPELFLFHYKDGRTAPKTRRVEKTHTFARRTEPLQGTQLKDGVHYSTDVPTLSSLRLDGDAQQVVALLLQRSKLQKQVSTYYHGIPKLYSRMDWGDDTLHGNLNHCVTSTGRLSSSNPNQQNLEDEVRKCVISRF